MKDRDILRHRRWLLLFAGIAVLVLAQVAWWAYVFTNDVSHQAQLAERLAVATGGADAATLAAIRDEAFHRRFMFLSESAFFGLLALAGLFVLFRGFKADRKARELQKSFIEIVSHESKTPLTALKLRLESLREKRSADAGVVKDIGSALDQVTRLASILEKALNLNRIEGRTFRFEEVSLNDVVKDVLHRLEPLSRAKAVSCRVRYAGEAKVNGDVYCLCNCVQNILENAILYNDAAEREVTISVSTEGSHALIAVEDNGPGLREGEEELLFQRFYRGAQSSRVPGTGLGLYLTRVVVEAHSGAVRAARSSFGRGTRFEIRLPTRAETPA